MPLKERDMIPKSDPRVSQFGHPAPPWLVNYADLMTEMVCFFVILYALSAALNKEIQKAKVAVQEMMKQEQVAGEVKMTKDGMQITLQENGQNVFFASGSADLSQRMVDILEKMSPTLRKLAEDGHDILVEGHTDGVPIHNEHFSSNWELSTARATNVVHHMIQTDGLPPKHMAAIGYGEYKPLVPNDTEEHRAANRRVVFFVKNKTAGFDGAKKKNPEEPPAPAAEAAAPAEEAAASTEEVAAPSEASPPADPSAEAPVPAEPTTEQTFPTQNAPAESAGE
jgi:flagellar motor protein MotB